MGIKTLTIQIDPELDRAFKIKLLQEDKTMKEFVTDTIIAYTKVEDKKKKK